jgi:hypothetical protein
MSRHRFAAFWATVLVVVGLVLLVSGVLLAVVAVTLDLPWASLPWASLPWAPLMEPTRLERIVVAIVLAFSGVLLGAPLIGLGELLHLSIAQRRLLERQRRRLARMARRGASAPERHAPGAAAADRLFRRRR